MRRSVASIRRRARSRRPGRQSRLAVEIDTRAPMPSLAAAWTLYQDTPREPGLVASADPPHPLSMPLPFPALNQ